MIQLVELGGFACNMKAIICEKDSYYISSIFAKIIDDNYAPDHAVYYYVVFNRERNKLVAINTQTYDNKDERGIELPREDWIKHIILLDDTNGIMKCKEKTFGDRCVYSDILYSIDPHDDIINDIVVTAIELKKCQNLDDEETVSLCGDLSSYEDWIRLSGTTYSLNNAKFSSIHLKEGGVEVVLKGDWGCKIKLSLQGNADFSIVNKKVGSTKEDIIFYRARREEGGSITGTEGKIFIGDFNVPPEHLLPSKEKGDTWFAAENITYEIIPNCIV